MKREKIQKQGVVRRISDAFRIFHKEKTSRHDRVAPNREKIAKRIENDFGEALRELAKR